MNKITRTIKNKYEECGVKYPNALFTTTVVVTATVVLNLMIVEAIAIGFKAASK